MSPGFDAARRAALMSDLVRHLRGRPAELLGFDEVRDELHLTHLMDRGLREVPLSQIVGSLGRSREFNRAFLPREEALRQRWTDVEGLARGPVGFPPIDLYQVGDVYFVVDGHHRVSVARRLGAPSIEARVREFQTPVAVDRHDSIEDILLKKGWTSFLDATGLVPESDDDFRATTVAAYERLLEHIRVHRYFRGIDLDRPFGWDEAVASWRDLVYRPMIRRICESGVMDDFEDRTPTDFYLFVMDHLHTLRERYDDRDIDDEAALRHLRWLLRARRGLTGWWQRLRQRLRERRLHREDKHKDRDRDRDKHKDTKTQRK
jgi:hypothetical protein